MATSTQPKVPHSDTISKADQKEALGAGERIIAKFHPHPISFIRWFLPSFLLFAWTILFILADWQGLTTLGPLSGLVGTNRNLERLIIWATLAVLIGFVLPRNPRTSKENVSAAVFLRAVRVLYWILVIVPVVLFAYIALSPNPPPNFPALLYLFAGLVSALMVLIYDLYRRSFSYFLTNFRIIFRYKFFKNVERTIRFSKVEDVEVSRTLLQRIFKLGNVRPYSGAEESLVDMTPGYDSPDECFFGVKNPEYVKRLMLEQMLGPQDAIQDSVYRTDAAHRAGGGMAGPAVAAGAAPAVPPAAPDPQRVERLEAELQRLRGETAGVRPPPGMRTASVVEMTQPPPTAPVTPAPSPPSGAGPLAEGAPEPAPPQKEREHAEFGDDRDALRASDSEFRGATQAPPKKPVPPGTVADEDDKPRSI